ncbi:SixA phosphatase family protein [Streptomyces sirii]|uniref:SixA phosphatase family protein n=1 Tax=Streptomyces sirii TaxID=3127701 RepID=UPI003D36D856
MSVDTTRRLVFLRHAKADWSQENDHERPLAERGRKDAPISGRWLAGAGVTPDLALCSTAVRCRETWQLVKSELPQQPKTAFEERVYEASVGELIAILNETSDEVNDLLLVGHNPGIQALTDALSGEAEGDLLARMNRSGFPTSAIAVVTFNGSWKSVEPGVGRLVALWSPHA